MLKQCTFKNFIFLLNGHLLMSAMLALAVFKSNLFNLSNRISLISECGPQGEKGEGNI